MIFPLLKTFAPILALTFVFILLAGVDPQVVDDTFITFQYATNLVEHGRLTWWYEGEMVDGFTSLGHTLLIAAGLWLGATAMATNMAINLFAMIAILLGVGYGTRSFSIRPQLCALAFTALSAPFIIWYGRGLDGILYAAVLFWVYLRSEDAIATGRLSWSLGGLLAILPVIRPEGLLVSPAVVGWLWLNGYWVQKPPKNVIPVFLAVVTSVVALLIWRTTNYGYPLPNTYYAKASASRWDEIHAGYRYVRLWISELGGFALLFPLLGFAAGTASVLRTLFIAGIVAIAVISGGDSHAYARFLLPAIPLLALDLAALIAKAAPKIRAGAVVLLAAYLGLQFAIIFARVPLVPGLPDSIESVFAGDWPYTTHLTDQRLEMRAEAITELDSLLPPSFPIVGTDVGALAYFSDREVIDSAGLNDKTLAHLPKPEGMLITWGYPGLPVLAERKLPFMFLYFPGYDTWSWNDLVHSPEICTTQVKNKATRTYTAIDIMDENYLCASLPSRTNPGGWINFHVHKDSLDLIDDKNIQYSKCVRLADQVCRTSTGPL